MSDLDRRIRQLAVRQHGLVSLDQVIGLGGDRNHALRRSRAGHWSCVGPGVYAIGAPPVTYPHRALGAVLVAGPGAVASHRCAARLWGVLGRTSTPLELSLPRDRHHRPRGVVVHRSRDLHLAATTSIDGIPVTGIARTLLDLGAVTPTAVRPAVWEALRAGLVGWDDLLRTLVDHARRGRPGLAALRAVVAEHYGEAARDSRTEDRAERILVDSGRVPAPVAQHPVVCADGVEVTVDFAWPEFRAALEVFGADHLTNEDLQHLDAHRRNQIELAGWRLLVYTGRLVRRQPDQLVADVVAMLRNQGWSP